MTQPDAEFEPVPEDALITGNISATPTVCPTPDGPMPGIMLRMPLADGSGFHPPVLLVMPDEQLPRVAQHFKKATDSAVAGARKIRRDTREAAEALAVAQQAAAEHAEHKVFTMGCRGCAIDAVESAST